MIKSNLAFAYLMACFFGLFPTAGKAQTSVALTRGNIQTTSSEEFVRFAWPSGLAPTIVERRVTMEGTMWPPLWPPHVELFQAPTPQGQRLCQRVSYELPLQWRDLDLYYSELNSGRPASVNESSQLFLAAQPRQIVGLSIAPNCRVTEDQQFASISTDYMPTAIIALNMLDKAHQEARRDRLPDFQIQCAIRSGPNRCAATPQESLAQLPIDLVWNIKPGDTANSFEFWINKPNQLVWEVTVVFAENKSVASVLMTSLIPNPF
jgi:hypothetical protein